jgi:hypothetical protein
MRKGKTNGGKMKGGNQKSDDGPLPGYDYDGVDQYGVYSGASENNMKGGNKKMMTETDLYLDFDFDKEWKEFEKNYNKKNMRTQRGGDESTATSLPSQYYNPDSKFASSNSGQSTSAYGKINAVDGLDVNLGAYPRHSGQQTGGRKLRRDKKLGDKNLGEKKLGDKNLGDKKLGEKKLGDKKLGEKKLGDKKLGDKKLGDKKLGEKKLGEKKLSDKKLGDKKQKGPSVLDKIKSFFSL